MSFSRRMNFDKLIAKQDAAIKKAIAECADDLSKASQAVCPKRRGYHGGLVSSVEVDLTDTSFKVGYAAPHAAIQHNSRNYKHKPGEQAMYLSGPLEARSEGYLARVADAIKRSR